MATKSLALIVSIVGILLTLGPASSGTVVPPQMGSQTPYLARFENAPLSAVLDVLSRSSGVTLVASENLRHERLDACVPSATLPDIMQSLAHLYRARWRKRDRSGAIRFVLEKPETTLREEAELRRACVRDLFENIDSSVRQHVPNPDLPAVRHLQYALRDSLRSLTPSDWNRLSTDSSLVKSLRTLPKSLANELTATNRRSIEDAIEAARIDSEERARNGETVAPETHPPIIDSITAAEGVILLDLKQYHGLHLWGSLSQGQVSGFTSLGRIPASNMVEMSRRPYEPRGLRPSVGGSGLSLGFEPSDPFQQTLPVKTMGSTDETAYESMCNLSESAGISIYSDRYSAPEPLSVSILESSNAESALNLMCQRRKSGGFWWRQGRTAYIRSVGWFWNQESLVPTDLCGALVASLRRSGRLTGQDLMRLSALTPAQVAGLLERPGEFSLWQMAIRVPAAAGGLAPEQASSTGLGLSDLAPTQIARLSSVGWPFPLKTGGGFQTRTTARLTGSAPQQGVLLELTTALNGVSQVTPITLSSSKPARLEVKKLSE